MSPLGGLAVREMAAPNVCNQSRLYENAIIVYIEITRFRRVAHEGIK
jgi:hypothetical protein